MVAIGKSKLLRTKNCDYTEKNLQRAIKNGSSIREKEKKLLRYSFMLNLNPKKQFLDNSKLHNSEEFNSIIGQSVIISKNVHSVIRNSQSDLLTKNTNLFAVDVIEKGLMLKDIFYFFDKSGLTVSFSEICQILNGSYSYLKIFSKSDDCVILKNGKPNLFIVKTNNGDINLISGNFFNNNCFQINTCNLSKKQNFSFLKGSRFFMPVFGA